MPESVDIDGAVRGPAPQGTSTGATFSLSKDSSRQCATDGSRIATKSAPTQTSAECKGKVISLELDENQTLRVEINESNRLLVEARSCLQQYEDRLERACANLLISGERIPALDQRSVSMMQEAYLNASTAAIVGSEKTIILEEQINRLAQRLSDIVSAGAAPDNAELRRAA